MQIAYRNSTESGAVSEREYVANLAPGVTPEQAAQAMNLAPGTWRVITQEEAAELQKPTREEEIKAAISALEFSVSERTKRGASLGKPDDVARLQAVEDQITALRDELAGL